jgi:hypothetical protein
MLSFHLDDHLRNILLQALHTITGAGMPEMQQALDGRRSMDQARESLGAFFSGGPTDKKISVTVRN